MKRSFSRQEQRLYITLAILAFFLAIVLLSSLVFAVRERARLEALREEESREDDRIAASTTVTPPAGTTPAQPIYKLGGYRLLGSGLADFNLFYFGDEMMYGRGVSDTLSTAVPCYRTMVKEGLQDRYGGEFLGRIPAASSDQTSPPTEGNGSPPLWLCDLDFDTRNQGGANFRLAILAPSDRTAAAGTAGHTSTGFTGSFARDLERTVRNMRRRAEACDILLIVPHDASDDVAGAILAIAAHYGLRSVDMRTLDGGLLNAGGFPTEAGHRAYADAILAEILDAVLDGHTTKSYPQDRLYN